MKSLRERIKASSYVLAYLLFLGGMMDLSINILRFFNGVPPILFWMPIFLFLWCCVFIASMVKYAYDLRQSNDYNQIIPHQQEKQKSEMTPNEQ